jgi:hypothetical protein
VMILICVYKISSFNARNFLTFLVLHSDASQDIDQEAPEVRLGLLQQVSIKPAFFFFNHTLCNKELYN